MKKFDTGQFNLGQDMALFYERVKCKTLCQKYNNLSPDMLPARHSLMKTILGSIGSAFLIEQPFICDYGYNIKIGDNFYSNHNLLILDTDEVTFGDNVLIGPDCSFYTLEHPVDVHLRRRGMNFSKPVTVGNNVWIGGHVTVLAGVTIGDNSVIGAGSLVTKDIPANSLALGVPCRVVKTLVTSD